MPSRHIVLVAGMHRSGTSALTRAINLAGVPLPRNLKPASPDVNAEGFWEPLDIKAFHDEILKAMNSSWMDPREVPLEWFDVPGFAELRSWLRDWIAAEIAGKDMLVIKDPRVCRLLPIWQRTCAESDIALHTAIIVRHPVEVARSLAKRDNFPELQSYVLWLRHFLDPERFTRGGSRTFLTYDQLMTDRLATIRRVLGDLNLPGAPADDAVGAELDAAVKDALRHHVATDADLAEAARQIPPLADVWAWVQRAANGENPDPRPLDAVTALMRQLERGPASNNPIA
ncbi:MAG: sulfotransferase family protein [Gemmatimonas sp.]